MQIEKIDLNLIKKNEYVTELGMLAVGESIYCTELKQAQSLRSLSYYLVKSRQLNRKFTFRKMDRGWRIIRVL
jgi:DhnA family fructose-bisphosphate aldolase class Ia